MLFLLRSFAPSSITGLEISLKINAVWSVRHGYSRMACYAIACRTIAPQKYCFSFKIIYPDYSSTDPMNTKTPIDTFSFRRILARNVTLPLVVGVLTAQIGRASCRERVV